MVDIVDTVDTVDGNETGVEGVLSCAKAGLPPHAFTGAGSARE